MQCLCSLPRGNGVTESALEGMGESFVVVLRAVLEVVCPRAPAVKVFSEFAHLEVAEGLEGEVLAEGAVRLGHGGRCEGFGRGGAGGGSVCGLVVAGGGHGGQAQRR